MEIYKLLDRFEILNGFDEYYANLRRAYIDQDLSSILYFTDNEELRKSILTKNLHSIFRVIDNKRCIGDIDDLRKALLENNLHSLFRLLPGNEDLRKAVIDENLHSIFRLIGNEDLKKVVMNDNVWSLFRLLNQKKSTNFVDALKILFNEDIEFDEDCFSRGQIQSKLWLVNELKSIGVDLGTVFLCAGWYGTLATMLFESGISLDKIRSFDIDESTESIAEIFNRPWVIDDWKFKPVVQDIQDINFEEHSYIVTKRDGDFETLWDTPNTIINTSCEHIENFDKWYDKIMPKQLVVLQGNDYFEIEEHVNCSKDLNEFSEKAPMEITLYLGEIDLGKYKRFMKIGYK